MLCGAQEHAVQQAMSRASLIQQHLYQISKVESDSSEFVRHVCSYAGDAKEDARIVQRARAQQAELQAATATIMLHAVDMLHAIVKACLKRDDMLPVRATLLRTSSS